jgi:hypothetical protein
MTSGFCTELLIESGKKKTTTAKGNLTQRRKDAKEESHLDAARSAHPCRHCVLAPLRENKNHHAIR